MPEGATKHIDVSMSSAWKQLDNLLDGFIRALPSLAIALVVFIGFWIIAKIVSTVLRRSTKSRATAVGKVFARLSYGGLIFVGLLVSITVAAPSVKPADLLATLGVGGVAIGFAFRDILQNFLAGILILVRQPFAEGDQIICEGHEGTVESIDTRSTILKTYDGRRIIIPNGEIYTESLIVNTAHQQRRTQYDIGIGYGDDIGVARAAIVEAINGVEGVLEDPAPEALVIELGDSAVVLRARWWTDSTRTDVLHAKATVLERIKHALDEAQVDMPYPTQVLLLHDQTEATDGDRNEQREGWPAGETPPEPRPIGRRRSQEQQTG